MTVRHNSREIPSLDGLRAVSIVLVLLAHAGVTTSWSVLHPWVYYGQDGVRVFFVISGYLITTLLLAELDRSGGISLRSFYLRRTLRIFPPYYVYLGAIALAAAVGLVAIPGARWWSALLYVSNLFPTRAPITGHSWSLAVEEQFYLTWPLMLALAGRRRAPKVALAALVLCPLIRVALILLTHDALIAREFDHDFIAVGCLLALWQQQLNADQRWRRLMASRWLLVLPLVVAGIERAFAFAYAWRFIAFITIGLTTQAICIGLCVAWCLTYTEGLIGRCLNSRPARWIGILSYSIYLWQEPFLPYSHFQFVPAVALVALCAVASYFLVERPALALRPFIVARLNERWLGWSDSPRMVRGASRPSAAPEPASTSVPDNTGALPLQQAGFPAT